MRLTGRQREELYNALISAFPTQLDLQLLVAFGMDESLETIARGTIGELVYGLVVWAEGKGRVEELVRAAVHRNPGHAALGKFAASLSANFAGAHDAQVDAGMRAEGTSGSAIMVDKPTPQPAHPPVPQSAATTSKRIAEEGKTINWNNAGDENELRRIYELIQEAASVRDPTLIQQYLADDFIHINSRGNVIYKADILKEFNNRPAISRDVRQLIIKGDQAVIVVDVTWSERHGLNIFRNVGTFSKREGQWQVATWVSVPAEDELLDSN
jgi:hypothetical protein